MNIFIDTNIIIGYSLETDKWNIYSERLIKSNPPIYCSTTVIDESEKKIKKINDAYNLFFNLVIANIKTDYLSKEEFLNNIPKIKKIYDEKLPFKTRTMALFIWNDGGFYEEIDAENLKKAIQKTKKNINETLFFNFSECQNYLRIYEINHSSEYNKLADKLESLKNENNKVHTPDNKILADCHFLSLSKKLNMDFVTSDTRLLEFKEEIKQLTNIKDLYFIVDAFYHIKNN